MSRWMTVAILFIAGALLLPATAYLAGGRAVGEYAGSRGLASYLGAIYADAGSGHPLAITLLLSPLIVAGIWALRGLLARRLWRHPE